MAGSQYGRPVIVGEGKDIKSVMLEPISLSGNKDSSGYDEEWLQKLAFENPALLPINQIDSSYEGLIPVCMELSTPAGFIDALYVTPKGKLVVVEAKLWRNPEARRKVVAQILDYAQALSVWSYENLLKEVCKATKRSGNALFDIVRDASNGVVDEQAFIDGVSRCLRTSEFLLLIVGDGIREGAGAIANFLEGAGRFNFTFGLVEMAIFHLDDGCRLVLPRVLAQTVLIERPRYAMPEVVCSVEDSGTLTDEGPDDDSAPALTAREAAHRDFWKAFIDQLKLDDQSQPMANVRPWSSIDFSGPPKTRSWFTLKTGPAGSDRATVLLTFERGPIGDAVYAGLRDQQDEIEKELSTSVRWETKDGKHLIVTEQQFSGDVLANERRQEVFAFLRDTLNRFVNAFRDRMVAIAGRQAR